MKRKIQNSRILVTGGAGFIGSNLIETLLAQDNDVVCLDNFSMGHRKNIEPFMINSRFKLIEGDIRDLEICQKACEDIDYVLHQAAVGSVPRSISDPILTVDVNDIGFLKMLVAARDAKVKRFIYAASSSIYGDSEKLPKIEDEIGKQLSPYAITKYVNELYAENFGLLYGMETIGLRYFNVFGRRQDPDGAYAAVIPNFVQRLIGRDSPVINGDGTFSRDFCYVDNVVQANQLAAVVEKPDAINTVYNIAFGSRMSLIDLFYSLRSALSNFDSAIGSIEPLFGTERIGDIPHSIADISKARNLLGYDPQFDVAAGLSAAAEWYWMNLRHGNSLNS